METDIGVFTFIGSSLDLITGAYVVPMIDRMVIAVTSLYFLFVLLSIMFHAIGIWNGAVRDPFWETVHLFIKFWVIGIIAVSSAGYTQWVVDLVNGLQVGMMTIITDTAPGATPYQIVDSVMHKADNVALWAYDQADVSRLDVVGHFGWNALIIMVQICTAIIAGAGGSVVIISGFLIQILLSLGSLFILLFITPVTRKFFEGWSHQIFNYILLGALAMLVLMMSISLFSEILEKIVLLGEGGEKVSPYSLFGSVILLTVFIIVVMYMVYSMASGLAGGLSVSAVTLTQLGRSTQPARNTTIVASRAIAATGAGIYAGGKALGRGGASVSRGFRNQRP